MTHVNNQMLCYSCLAPILLRPIKSSLCCFAARISFLLLVRTGICLPNWKSFALMSFAAAKKNCRLKKAAIMLSRSVPDNCSSRLPNSGCRRTDSHNCMTALADCHHKSTTTLQCTKEAASSDWNRTTCETLCSSQPKQKRRKGRHFFNQVQNLPKKIG